MRKLYKINSMALIFTLIVVFLCVEFAYPFSSKTNLRPPVGISGHRIQKGLEEVGSRSGSAVSLPLGGDKKIKNRWEKRLLWIATSVIFFLDLGAIGGFLTYSYSELKKRTNYFSYDINRVELSLSLTARDIVDNRVISSQQLMEELNQASAIISKYKEGILSVTGASEQIRTIRARIVGWSMASYLFKLDFQNKKVLAGYLLDRLEEFDSQEIDSIELYWEVVRMKIIILYSISEVIIDEEPVLRHAITERFSPLLIRFISEAFEPSVELGYNVTFTIEFPSLNQRIAINRIFAEYAWFTAEKLGLQISDEIVSPDVLAYLKFRATTELGRQDIVFDFFLYNVGTVEEVTRQLSEINQMEKDDLHKIPLDAVDTIEEIRRLPVDYHQYIAESAKANRIPERLLVYSIIMGNLHERTYAVGSMSEIAKRRETIPGVLVDATRSLLPYSVLSHIPSPKISSYIGGYMGAEPTMGMTKIRPTWARRHNAWQRFGIDANKLSDGEITELMFNPKFNIEAAACMWRGAIDWVKKQREEALTKGVSLDLSTFDAEGTERETIAEDPGRARYIPLMDSDTEWLLAIFHPQREWFLSKGTGSPGSSAEVKVKRTHWKMFDIQKFIILSGVLDEKAAIFTGIRDQDDIDELEYLLLHPDDYIRSAAERTLGGNRDNSNGSNGASSAVKEEQHTDIEPVDQHPSSATVPVGALHEIFSNSANRHGI